MGNNLLIIIIGLFVLIWVFILGFYIGYDSKPCEVKISERVHDNIKHIMRK